MANSRIFVDTFEGALREAGDLLDPLARGVIARQSIEGELADLVCGEVQGRRDDRGSSSSSRSVRRLKTMRPADWSSRPRISSAPGRSHEEGLAMTVKSASEIHAESVVIDAVCPLVMHDFQYLEWYREGGVTAIAPTVATVDGTRATLDRLARWHRLLREP